MSINENIYIYDRARYNDKNNNFIYNFSFNTFYCLYVHINKYTIILKVTLSCDIIINVYILYICWGGVDQCCDYCMFYDVEWMTRKYI